MKPMRWVGIVGLATLSVTAWCQAWSASYQEGLNALNQSHFIEARSAFLLASANRPDDYEKPTRLPGAMFSKGKMWRDGAPYSPNFLAAYSGFKGALLLTDAAKQKSLLQSVSDEFLALISRGQACPATAYYLNACFAKLDQPDRSAALLAKLRQKDYTMSWKVDTQPIDPQELDLIAAAGFGPALSTGGAPASNTTPTRNTNPDPGATPGVKEVPTANPNVSIISVTPAGGVGTVATLPDKFALLIGNAAGGGLPYAPSDVQTMKAALTTYGGYADANVELLTDTTVAQIRAKSADLAARMKDGAVILIYFTGGAVDLGGKDFVAGADSNLDDASSMLAKNELYRPFVARGARLFAFYQVNRPFSGGKKDGPYFGMEDPGLGAICQGQATAPGGQVFSIVKGGREVGLFTDAFAGVLNDFRTNRVPIMEFGWQLFDRIRRGDTGSSGGSSVQTPTLPTLKNLASDARF